MLSRISAQLVYCEISDRDYRYNVYFDGEEVLTAKYSESGMPYVGLTDLLHLPNISRVCGDMREEVHLTDSMHCNSLTGLIYGKSLGVSVFLNNVM